MIAPPCGCWYGCVGIFDWGAEPDGSVSFPSLQGLIRFRLTNQSALGANLWRDRRRIKGMNCFPTPNPSDAHFDMIEIAALDNR
jgi:hypothetical protein